MARSNTIQSSKANAMPERHTEEAHFGPYGTEGLQFFAVRSGASTQRVLEDAGCLVWSAKEIVGRGMETPLSAADCHLLERTLAMVGAMIESIRVYEDAEHEVA